MNRRDFLRLVASGVVGLELDVDKLLWIPGAKKIFIPSLPIPISLYGIPYHHSDATMGQWLGFQRQVNTMMNNINDSFNRDDPFYAALTKGR